MQPRVRMDHSALPQATKCKHQNLIPPYRVTNNCIIPLHKVTNTEWNFNTLYKVLQKKFSKKIHEWFHIYQTVHAMAIYKRTIKVTSMLKCIKVKLIQKQNFSFSGYILWYHFNFWGPTFMDFQDFTVSLGFCR